MIPGKNPKANVPPGSRTCRSPDVIERYAGLGGEPRTSTPDELAHYIKSEMAKWTQVAQAQKIRVDLTR